MKSDVKFILITIGTVFILVYLLFAGIPFLKKNSSNDDRLAQPEVTSSRENPSKQDSKASETNDWKYTESKDDMRGVEKKSATLLSNNTVDLESANIKKVKAILLVNNDGNGNSYVSFGINNGKLSCTVDCKVSIKMDDSSVTDIPVKQDRDADGKFLLVKDDVVSNNLVQSFKNTNKLTVELPVLDNGDKQFSFLPSGFIWEDPSVAQLNKPNSGLKVNSDGTVSIKKAVIGQRLFTDDDRIVSGIAVPYQNEYGFEKFHELTVLVSHDKYIEDKALKLDSGNRIDIECNRVDPKGIEDLADCEISKAR